jgi:alkylation response protein AidB-like acyl-CoA dehydrogenase
MDVRLSAEQRALRDSAARVVNSLAPRTVRDLDDLERADKLDTAVDASGWRELRTAVDGGAPLASAVEAALIAEELGRGPADTAFLGPTLAAEFRRMAAAPTSGSPETVAFVPDLSAPACTVDDALPSRAVAIDARGATSALVLVPVSDDYRGVRGVVPPQADRAYLLAAVALPDAGTTVDLTRPGAVVEPAAAVPIPGQGRPITAADLARWTSLGLALTCADLVGAMRGAVNLGCEYAKTRRQYGAAIGSFQAVQHRLADAFVSLEGSRSVALHAAWAVDASSAWHQALYDAGFFGLSWPPEIGGQGLPGVYEVIVDSELAAAGAPPRPSVGFLVEGILRHGNDDIKRRFLPGIVSGRDRWCQGFSEPDAGSDLASLRTRAELVKGDGPGGTGGGSPPCAKKAGGEYVVTGHKVWTSYSDEADWCLLLARTDPDVPRHRGISAFAVSMHQPGVTQRPLKMINGITKEFGEVIFDGARAAASGMIGEPGEGWPLAMTVVSHEREPGQLGYVARYRKSVDQLARQVREDPARFEAERLRDLAWAMVEAEMLRLHVCRRLSDRLDGTSYGPEGSVDKLLMTSAEQAVGRAALTVGGAAHDGGDDTWLNIYLYSRAQSVMGGTSEIQRNLVATRILGLPTS